MNKRGLAFLLQSFFFAFIFVLVLFFIGLVNNREQTLYVEWGYIGLGPFAGYFTCYSIGNGSFVETAIFSFAIFASWVPELIQDSIFHRMLAALGVCFWVLMGFADVMVWA